ncbi:MAG: DUF5665 domain-containing protein [Candidatus Shapirobacteria bacterium]
MTPDQDLIDQLKILNRRLDIINNPFKNAGYNFVSGIFRSLGSLFGTIVVAGAIFYFFSSVDLVKPITTWVENIMSQINWEKIVPTPTYDQNSLNQYFQKPTPTY